MKAAKKDEKQLFMGACDGTRENKFKVKEARFRLDISKKFLSVLVVRHWKILTRKAVDASSLGEFQARLGGILSKLFNERYPWQGELELHGL